MHDPLMLKLHCHMRFILITARDRQPHGALALGPARITISLNGLVPVTVAAWKSRPMGHGQLTVRVD